MSFYLLSMSESRHMRPSLTALLLVFQPYLVTHPVIALEAILRAVVLQHLITLVPLPLLVKS